MELKHSFTLKVGDEYARFALVVCAVVTGLALVVAGGTVTLITIADQGSRQSGADIAGRVRPGHGLDQAQKGRIDCDGGAVDHRPDLAT